MIYLIIVSLIWAFSFGLIKTNLTSLDSNFVAFLRLLISLLVFLPFLRVKGLSKKNIIYFMGIGAIQYGIMYITYINSYQYLKAYEVALFTILTPIYLTLFNDIIEKKFNRMFFLSSLLAVVGAAIIKFDTINSKDFLNGFLLVQISNISFAAGQILYVKKIKSIKVKSNISIFAILYVGAVIVTFITTLFTTDYTSLNINNEQIFTIIYLGVMASGLAFYLWNVGATKVNTGTLAIFNNLKLPLGIFVSLFVFGENTNIIKLVVGVVIMTFALYINEYQQKQK